MVIKTSFDFILGQSCAATTTRLHTDKQHPHFARENISNVFLSSYWFFIFRDMLFSAEILKNRNKMKKFIHTNNILRNISDSFSHESFANQHDIRQIEYKF